ncbi:hypothetical protein SAMN04487911_13015 [Arenibacter nanhaiticus]|uniref:Uncharacterized protein n=1 Tax=Arenibacter nanhaiticus TaxID=558155 RepID=A0A1M6L7X2_9FLAO|nr:hypothetical protein [Arenibacter nanhaiticus]SHJ67328.1 hypothetical protein SAMN04487911_13015 [Arenibacter nanhaiticus]
MEKDFFKRPEFQNRLDKANEKISSYLTEKGYILKDLKAEELIQWHDITPEERNVYPNEKCPTEIKNIVAEIIQDEFNIGE